MKFFTVFILSALTAYAAFLFSDITPWWMFAVGAFLAGWAVPVSAFKTWVAGFSGVFVAWAVLCFIANDSNNGILASKMSLILPLQGSGIALILISALVGALVGGFAAMTGSFLRRKPVK
ncbi:MAG: hypothetical protein MUE99_10900 [Chitinophagaceae bacterium]|jgi:hypothetical protein|nr:hypothetical protein [Chitinophagaceae bacterium]